MPDAPLPERSVTAELPTGAYEVSASTLGHDADSALADSSGRVVGSASFALPPGFEFIRLLGRGGMGVVFCARQTALKREVAIKMIQADRGITPDRISRFRSEAEAVARFQHPNIVQIHEVGEVQGLPYCILEYVGGGTLADRLRSERMKPDEAARTIECLARAVHYAHQRHIIHRDLKPANILLAPDGTPKIADFGLAKHLDDDAGQTQDGDVLGTPKYMAPEQARGDHGRTGPQTDVHALGAILYEMIAGRAPFAGESTLEVLDKVRHVDPAPPRGLNATVPKDLETICLKCLRKEPVDRYSSALMLAQDLERHLSGEPILARPEGVVRRSIRFLRRRRASVLASAAVAAVLFAVYIAGDSRKVQHSADLEQRIQDSLEASNWMPDAAASVHARIAELDAEAPERAAALRSRAYERHRQSVIADLRQPRLDDAAWAGIEAKVRDLNEREPSFGADLRSRMQERRSETIRILDLEPPFAKFEASFKNPDWLALEPACLRRVQPFARPLITTIPSDGSIRVEARIEGWREASRVGITLGTLETPYQFLLASARPDGSLLDSPLSLAAERGATVLLILRGNVELLRRTVQTAGDAVVIRAERDGDRLAVQLDDHPSVECFDPFPLPEAGAVGFDIPAGAGLRRANAVRRAAPRSTSPLEEGNRLYQAAEYESARGFFQQFRAGSADSALRAEARYKIAVCLARQDRFQESADFLEKNDDAPPGRWHALGLLQHWRVLSELGHLARGAEVFRVLKAQYPPEDLLHLVPAADLFTVWRKYDFPPTDVLFTDNATDRARTLVEIGDLLRRTSALSLSNWARSVLLYDRALQNDRQREKAVALLAESIKSVEFLPPSEDRLLAFSLLLEDYVWLLGITGGRDFALIELDRFEPDAGDRSISADRLRMTLSISRARLHAQAKDWSRAERQLDRFASIRTSPAFDGFLRKNRHGSYYFHCTEHILRGVVREEQGDAAGAARLFLAGTRRAFLESLPADERAWRLDQDSNTIRDNLYMATRSGTLTDAEAAEERDNIVKLFRESKSIGAMAGLVPLPPDALRTMWKLSSSRTAIRAIQFREVDHTDATWLPIRQLAMAVFNVEAVTQLSAENEAMLGTLLDRMIDLLKKRKLGRSALAMLGNVWVSGPGSTGSFGWQGLRAALPKDDQPVVAWAFGHRYLKLGKPADARFYFEQSRLIAPDSPAARLSIVELERLPR